MNELKALSRLWGTGSIRVFISHVAESKELATSLKEYLRQYDVAGFVAHEDIEPTREWQGEIERALFSMHMLVPLLTEKFHESDWTDQEIGVAVGREVPIISIRRGKDPYGFIGKYQAMQGKDKDAEQIAEEFFGLLFQQGELKELATNTFITTVAGIGNWGRANSLARLLPSIEGLSPTQAESLVRTYQRNSEVRNAFGFNGKHPSLYGNGLLFHLKRITGDEYRFRNDGGIERGVADPNVDDLPF